MQAGSWASSCPLFLWILSKQTLSDSFIIFNRRLEAFLSWWWYFRVPEGLKHNFWNTNKRARATGTEQAILTTAWTIQLLSESYCLDTPRLSCAEWSPFGVTTDLWINLIFYICSECSNAQALSILGEGHLTLKNEMHSENGSCIIEANGKKKCVNVLVYYLSFPCVVWLLLLGH